MTDSTHVVLSVVASVYQSAAALPELCERLDKTLRRLTPDYEIIFVDDRSTDGSWEVIQGLLSRFPHLIGVRLSRNFGQHYALTAGLDLARGEWTVVMDGDMQDRPEDIEQLLAKARDGFDIVVGRRVARQDPLAKRLWSALFHRTFAMLSGYRLDPSVGPFRIMNRRVVDAFCQMREAYRLFGGLVEWVGFSSASIETQHAARLAGRSSYRWRARFKVGVDGIVSFSNRPLYVSAFVGAMMSAVSGASVLLLIAYFLATGRSAVAGWLSLLAATTFIGGLVLFNLGIIGLYVGRMYNEVKRRPLYIVDRVIVGAGVAPDVAEPRQTAKCDRVPSHL